MKRLAYTAIFLLVLLSFFAKIPAASADTEQAQEGVAGYFSDTGEIDDAATYMAAHNLTMLRMSFNPSWGGGDNPYNFTLVKYFFDNYDFTLIVDRNHIYPASTNTHWGQTLADCLELLSDVNAEYGDSLSDQLIVEIVNECTQSDLATQIQTVVTAIRGAGYTNALLVNKWTQSWTSMAGITDTLDRLIFGYHYYFNFWSLAGAVNDMNTALHDGLAIINTEIGASSLEKDRFTSSNVGILNSFLAWSYTHGVSNCVWMNTDLDNAATYTGLSLTFLSQAPVEIGASATVFKPSGLTQTVYLDYSHSSPIMTSNMNLSSSIPANSSIAIYFKLNLENVQATEGGALIVLMANDSDVSLDVAIGFEDISSIVINGYNSTTDKIIDDFTYDAYGDDVILHGNETIGFVTVFYGGSWSFFIFVNGVNMASGSFVESYDYFDDAFDIYWTGATPPSGSFRVLVNNNGGTTRVGQSFHQSTNKVLTGVKLSLETNGFLSTYGNSYVQIYAMTGTFGVNSRPTGSVLATSRAVQVSPYNNPSLATWTFNASNTIMLQASHYYCLVFVSPIGPGISLLSSVTVGAIYPDDEDQAIGGNAFFSWDNSNEYNTLGVSTINTGGYMDLLYYLTVQDTPYVYEPSLYPPSLYPNSVVVPGSVTFGSGSSNLWPTVLIMSVTVFALVAIKGGRRE